MKTIIRFDGDYRFLSNFWRSEVSYEGIKYPTSEHAYQASKSMDSSDRQRIADIPKPGDVKKEGRKLQLRSDWEQVKDDVMLDIVRIKFTSNPDLAKKLLDTDDAILVEGNHWHDVHFGVCYCDKCKGIGENKLGEALMKVRGELKFYSPEINAKSEPLTVDISNSLDIPEI